MATVTITNSDGSTAVVDENTARGQAFLAARARGATSAEASKIIEDLTNQAIAQGGNTAEGSALLAQSLGSFLAGTNTSVIFGETEVAGETTVTGRVGTNEERVSGGQGSNPSQATGGTGDTTTTTTTADTGSSEIADLIKLIQQQNAAKAQTDARLLEIETAFREAQLKLQSSTAIGDIINQFSQDRATFTTPFFLAGQGDQVPLDPRLAQILRGAGVNTAGNTPGTAFLRPGEVNQGLIRDLIRNIGSKEFNVLSNSPDTAGQFQALSQIAGIDPRSVVQQIISRLPRQPQLGSVGFTV